MSQPAIYKRPLSGRSSPHRHLNVVVLPAPVTPKRANDSPYYNANETLSTALWIGPYAFDSDRTST